MSKLDVFRQMVAKNPQNPLAHFGLANEALKEGLHEEGVTHLQAYLGMHDDEGNAWGRLGEALIALGRAHEGADALRRGIAAAQRFGHPGMANELTMRLEELEDES